MNGHGLLGELIFGGLVVSLMMFLQTILRLELPPLERCSFERVYRAVCEGGRLSCNYGAENGSRPYGLSNHLCLVHYNATNIDNVLHEYVDVSVHTTVGIIALRCINGEISEWMEDELPITPAMTTSLHWRLENLLEKIRDSVASYEVRQRELEAVIHQRT